MKGLLENEARTVVPRWRFSLAALNADDELSSVKPAAKWQPALSDTHFYEKAVAEFREGPSIWNAGDLLPVAIARNDRNVATDIAKFILSSDAASPIARDLSIAQLEGYIRKNARTSNEEVHALRRSLSSYSRNALGWIDLALHYTLRGKSDRARRSVLVALQLAPNNRFVLRSASRFFIHQDEPDLAHAVFGSADRTKHDPWLVAGEIATATAAGRWPKLVKIGREMLRSGDFLPKHVSELASALATAEWKNGHGPHRQLRTLMRRSLEDPTENSVAQARWLTLNQPEPGVIDPGNIERSDTSEATAWKRFSDGDFEGSRTAAEEWLSDQPFSSRPAGLLSFILESILNDYGGAVEVLEAAVIPNSNDSLLWNNLSFAYASLDRISEAERALRRARAGIAGANNELVVMATQGLIAFRSGNLEDGRAFYQRVIDRSGSSGSAEIDERIHVFALAYYAREEARAGDPLRAEAFLKEASARARKIRRLDTLKIVSGIGKEVFSLSNARK